MIRLEEIYDSYKIDSNAGIKQLNDLGEEIEAPAWVFIVDNEDLDQKKSVQLIVYPTLVTLDKTYKLRIKFKINGLATQDDFYLTVRNYKPY